MPPAKVLVIDDDPILLQTISEVLLKHDFEVHLCADGGTGTKLAQTYRPDIILLDVLLPESDGFAVLAALKGAEETARIPVVLMTGFADEAGARRAAAMGAEAYVTKTLRADKLVQVIRERLAGAEALRNLSSRTTPSVRFQRDP